MSAALPFPSKRFLHDARHKSSLPPVLPQSDSGLQVLASPVIQVVSQPRDFESPTFPPSAVATPSPSSSATDGLKSKGRRRDPNHVPRPLNSFFLFKADWLAKRKSLLAGIEQDHRQLNRMASSEWKGLPQEVKQRFKDAAHSAKVEHATKYPEYRFTPKPRGDRRRRKTRRNEPEVLLRNEEAARLVSQGITGDTLLEALADYDRRATVERRRPFSRAASPPPFPEASPYTAPASSPVTPPFSSVGVYSSPNLAVQPISALFDLMALPGILAEGSHPVHRVASPQHAPVVDDIQAIPPQDPCSLHFDYLLPGDSVAPIAQPRGLSNQFLQADRRIGHESDWSHHWTFPIGETQGTAPMLACPSFQTCSGLVQAMHMTTPTNTSENCCWNIAALQQDLFSSHDFANGLDFTVLCTSGISGGASSIPGDSQGLFLPIMDSTYHWPAFPSGPALSDSSATDGLDLDLTIPTD